MFSISASASYNSEPLLKIPSWNYATYRNSLFMTQQVITDVHWVAWVSEIEQYISKGMKFAVREQIDLQQKHLVTVTHWSWLLIIWWSWHWQTKCTPLSVANTPKARALVRQKSQTIFIKAAYVALSYMNIIVRAMYLFRWSL